MSQRRDEIVVAGYRPLLRAPHRERTGKGGPAFQTAYVEALMREIERKRRNGTLVPRDGGGW